MGSIKYFNEGVDDEDQYFDLKQKAREQLQQNWNSAVDAYIDAKREEFAKDVPAASKKKTGGKRL